MKKKYKRFTQNHMYGLAWAHKNVGGVKDFIADGYNGWLYSKKLPDSKHLYHQKFDVVLGTFLDCRRARRVIRNAALFEEFFEEQMRILSLRIGCEVLRAKNERIKL